MDPHRVRSELDRQLAATLARDPAVKRVIDTLAGEQSQRGTRRSLLAQALRLSPAIAPALNAILANCIEILGVETEVELFVYPSAQYNAACTQQEGDRVFVLLSSELAEGFDPEELAYVVGHELGHHIYGHHEIPLQALLEPSLGIDRSVVLQAFTWQRHAEISADRAGLLCCGGLGGAARALFKLSSGFHQAPDEAGIAAFLEQAEELYRESEPEDSTQRVRHTDYLSTHPFSPLRLRAAQAFMASEVFVKGGTPLAALEVTVLDIMAVMEGNYLDEASPTAAAMRRLLFAAGLLVAAASAPITPKEVAALESLLGPGSVPASIDIERLRGLLGRRVEEVKTLASPARRATLLRDLVVLARADGRIDAAETDVMHALARALEVDPLVVDAVLRTATTLDWPEPR